jgi:hypothetical protein
MTETRMEFLKTIPGSVVSREELREGWHFCLENEGELVGPGHPGQRECGKDCGLWAWAARHETPDIPRWIPLCEQVPHHGEKVLVTDGCCRLIAHLSADGCEWKGQGNVQPTRQITHWMPLPEPPCP